MSEYMLICQEKEGFLKEEAKVKRPLKEIYYDSPVGKPFNINDEEHRLIRLNRVKII